jgi:hypothetical protein
LIYIACTFAVIWFVLFMLLMYYIESQGAVIRTMSNSRWKENNLIVLTWQSLPHFFKRCLMFFVVGDLENDKLLALMASIFSHTFRFVRYLPDAGIHAWLFVSTVVTHLIWNKPSLGRKYRCQEKLYYNGIDCHKYFACKWYDIDGLWCLTPLSSIFLLHRGVSFI